MSIIGSLPNTLTNGTTADATQVMADFNAIVNSVNANAAAITSVQQNGYNYTADSGTVNNIIVGMTPSPAVYVDGLTGNFKAANTNTSTTVNIKYGSLGNKALVTDQAGTLPPIGSIISGMHYRTEYDSTQDKVILLNPSAVASSYTGTGTGLTTSPTCTVKFVTTADGAICALLVGTGVTGTSNSTALTITGGPAAIFPASAQSFIVYVEDAGANAAGSVTINAGAGVLICGKGSSYAAGGFTNTATTKAFPVGGAVALTYELKI